MSKLPAISGAQAVKAFERAGWRQDRQRGSHIVMLKTTAQHNRLGFTYVL